MNQLALALVFVLAMTNPGGTVSDQPRMEDVVASPADYAGQDLQFTGATLSGALVKYDVGGVRKYYLTVSSAGKDLEIGFFLAPPELADKLTAKLNPRRNYAVNLTCKVAKIVINDVPQWHAIVSRVDFVDGNGQVVDTLQQGK
jgi:hypothetical protein